MFTILQFSENYLQFTENYAKQFQLTISSYFSKFPAILASKV